MRPARPRAAGVGVWRTDLDAVAQFRESTDATRGYDVLTGAFPPGTVNPTAILVDRPGGAVRPQDVAEVARRAQAVPGVAVVSDTGRRSADGRAAVLSVIYEDDPFGPAALERTELLREELGGRESDLRVLVGSGSGERLDALDASVRDARVIVPLVLLVVFVTLVVLLRAVVAPLVLLATVILSFAGTLGASLLAFKYLFDQDGNKPGARPRDLHLPRRAGLGLQHLPDEPRA